MVLLSTVGTVLAADIFETFYEGHMDDTTDQDNVWEDSRVSTGATTTPSSSIVTMDGQVSETPVKSLSVEAIFTDNVQTYNIPLSYGFPLSLTGNKEMLNFKLILPYTRREVGTVSDSGLGDISLTTNYLIRFSQFLMDSKLIIKAPTGEFEDADVPLGTGSTDVGVYFNGTWYMDAIILKAGLGYAYNGDYDQGQDEVAYGDEYLVSAGADYIINDTMKAGGLLLYKSRAEDKADLVSMGMTSYHAGINSLDLIPGFSWLYKKYNVEMTVSAPSPSSSPGTPMMAPNLLTTLNAASPSASAPPNRSD
jgi:hypothetical protein